MHDDARSDGALVAAALAGDDVAFGTLVTRHARAALAVARGVVGDADLAEDVCQEALFRVWRRLSECRDPDRFRSWLGRAVHRHALNATRSIREARLPEGFEAADRSMRPDRDAERSELRSRLERALGELPPAQRTAVLLFDLEGWSHAEIADVLDTSEAMSRQHLMAGRARMRELLGEGQA